MIKEKSVTIKKQNTFDLGYALFVPYDTGMVSGIFGGTSLEDETCGPVTVDEIVGKITFATEVVLILKDFCLLQKIQNELQWTDRYAEISVYAATGDIIERFSGINISKAVVDPSIAHNYIGISRGAEKSSYFLDGPYATDDSVERLYLDKPEIGDLNDFSVLTGSSFVIIAGKGESYNDKVFDYCKNNGVDILYIAPAVSFDENLYDITDKAGVELLVAESVSDGVYSVTDGHPSKIVSTNGVLSKFPLTGQSSFLTGPVYRNIRASGKTEDFPDNLYIVWHAGISKFSLEETHTVGITLYLTSMEDFLEENFDTSETVKHDDYASVALSTTYVYTLYPPRFDKGKHRLSSIYDELNSCVARWYETYAAMNVNRFLSVSASSEKIREFADVIHELMTVNSYFADSLSKLDLVGYSTKISDFAADFNNRFKGLYGICHSVFSEIKHTDSESALARIEDDIEKARQTISECMENISLSRNVVDNSVKMELAKDTIRELVRQKEQIERQSEGPDSEAETFVSAYRTLIDILESMKKIDLPERYMVYEAEGQRYIVISDEQEFRDVADLCGKFSLQCLSKNE
ncbi:MAG: hypothetical protein LUD72_08755 [Bacteroidales bacterium]|nr:hypothetical protein [Bacteroidales bacterium]